MAWSGRADYRRDNRERDETVCAENTTASETGKLPEIPVAQKSDF